MDTSLWLSAGWLLLLIAVSLTADKKSLSQQTAVGPVLSQSSYATPSFDPGSRHGHTIQQQLR